MPHLSQQIRPAAERVSNQARHVRVRENQIPAFARTLLTAAIDPPSLDAKSHFIASPPETIAFFLTLDAINFGSGYFPHLAKLPGKSGYFTVATRLTERFRARGPLSAEELLRMNAESCRALFQQDKDAGPIDELMSLFARALNDLGKLLIESFDRSFVALVESADHSAQNLVRILDRMPMFHDVQNYRGEEVPFFKRAQLTAADLNLALQGDGLGRFDDLDELTIFADNLVPHVLRCDGVLEYDGDLAARIERGELIAKDSEEEIEIRACAVHASELIVKSLREDGKPITSMQVDYVLWNRGQRPEYKARPRHRCRSWFY